MIENKIISEFSGEINKIQFEDKKLYTAVLEAAQRIERDGFKITKDLIAELKGFFEKISEKLEISYEKISKTLNYVFEHSKANQIETIDLFRGFNAVDNIENENCEYEDIYGEYIQTCGSFAVELRRLKKLSDIKQ